MSTKSARFVVSAVALLMPFYLSGLAGCGTPQQQAEPEAAREPIPEPVSDEPTLASKDGPLAINNVVPTRGLVESNTIVLVEGEGFTPGMWVYFGDQPAKEVFVLTDGMLTAITPAHPTGTVDVRLDAQVQGQRYEVGMPEAFAFFALPDEDPGTDKDGDGLTDLEEITGWDIKVDIFGFGLNPGHFGSFLEHHVDSNPGVGETDTDNDGLTDLEEFFVKSNPRDPDTDGDGLWDGEEWHRWLTSPISVDTDGDARSADPSSPQSTLPPNASLFDGAELYDFIELAKDPADRGPIKFNATSPTLDDTDGDNVRDLDEIDTPVRSPLLADMPQLLFEIVDDVDMRLDIEYAEEEGRTTAFETSFATATEVTSGETSTTGTTAGTSTTESDWNSNTVSASVTVGVEVGFGPLPSATGSVEVSAGFEHSWGSQTDTTSTFEQTSEQTTSRETSQSSEQTFSQMEEKSRAFTETAATGSMTAGIKITNIGNISVQVIDLVYTVRQWLPNTSFDPQDTSPGEYVTMATLVPDLGPGLTLSPGGDSGVILASAENVNVDRMKAFFAKPGSLQIEPAAFELVNAKGFNFAFIEEITRARTARLSIDFGGDRFEEYRIATNVNRNPDGTLAGITLGQAMDLTVGPGNWETASTSLGCAGGSGSGPPLTTNNSFELPVVPLESVPNIVPTDWSAITTGTGLVGAFHWAAWPAPDGDQWAALTVDLTSTAAMYQQIGTIPALNTDCNYSFTITPTFPLMFTYAISLWTGDPGAGGTKVDEVSLLSPLNQTTVTGTINTGLGPAGSDLYVMVTFYVDEHNTRLPHSAFRGQTPDEMYFGTGDRIPDELDAAKKIARQSRMEVNRATLCPTCQPLVALAS